MKLQIPRIMIAGTHSGTGKTSLSVALTAALKRRGLTVQTFKVGPDFLDPTYLSLASGRPCYNLDGWMTGKNYVTGLFARASAGADIAVIEGVMGLFDGAEATSSEGSTAEIARWLSVPVLLVIDAQGASRSIAALVKGYATFEKGVKIAAVVANRCSSDQHARWIAASLFSAGLPPFAGAVARDAFPPLSSRHLGLVAADGKSLSEETLASYASVLEKSLSLETILRIARASSPVICRLPVRKEKAKKICVGIAYDEAFHFYYRDTLDEMEARGCEIALFSPIRDERLPAEITGLYIGGGYPEVYARELSENRSMMEAIRAFAASDHPLYGECGGLLYLSRSLETVEGTPYPLVGIIPASARMGSSKKFLGYVEVTLAGDSLWGMRGDMLRGHEFHYSELIREDMNDTQWNPAYTLKRNRSKSVMEEGFQCGNILASYAHLHLASRPSAVERFVSKCGGVV